ncbi:MAG: type I DNA topoisomerase, partial [Pseudomonadota bacterium]
MAKSLVIVESPAKAKTINKYLGAGFIVKSSVGHVRDLPVSGSGVKAKPGKRAGTTDKSLSVEEKLAQKNRKAHDALIQRMGVDPEHNWKAHYEILPNKTKVIEDLKKAAAQADRIFLATDLDREGEAIAWHLSEVIGGDPSRYQRVVFNEITKNAIQEAFAKPTQLNMPRVNAQQARRFLDRVVGYMVSPLLWAKVARGLSAGRVQSVAVRLIVEREREIRAFIPEEYWEIFAHTETQKKSALPLMVMKHKGESFKPKTAKDADTAVKALENAEYTVSDKEEKPTLSRPVPPFITSTLQQSASTRLGFSVKKTMTMAQRLYEAGIITYMRTDSTNLSKDALEQARNWIGKKYGKDYLPETPNFYSSKEGAQEAHEAIRPTDVSLLTDQLQSVERDAQRLYELIWQRFVACQMTPAKFIATTVWVKADKYDLKARGRVMMFDGHLRVMSASTSANDEPELPLVQVGEKLKLNKLDPKQHFTKPLSRFAEASLVKELEKRGIGRPSTYANIISTIQERGYVKLENRRFYAEKMGEVVTDRLFESFSNLMDYDFTAKMEEKLDQISNNNLDWRQVLNDFYGDFKTKLKTASLEDTGMRTNRPVDVDIVCPTCGRQMQVRTASTGIFLGCSGYALPPKERCTTTINLIPGKEVVKENSDEWEVNELRAKRRCPKCNTAMDSFLIDADRRLHLCGNAPDCNGHDIEAGQFKIKGYEGPVIECDKCGSEMQLKTGRFGKYFGCTGTDCKNTRKLLKSGQPAPPKAEPIKMPHLRCEKSDDFYLLRDGAAGLFLAASQFPKHRETRA